MRRSMLFLPGSTPNKIINGDSMGADAIILDLEDAVSPEEKDAARILVRNAIRDLKFPGVEIIVRVNSLDTPYWKADLDEIVPLKPDLIMPPKTATAKDVQAMDVYISTVEKAHGMAENTVKLIPLIETAMGVENSYQIAFASKRVVALFLGGEDLSADLHCHRTKEGNEIDYARKRLVCAARAAGVEIYDTPFTDVNDDEGMLRDAEYAKSLGFTGKASISPRHVSIINEVFSPTREEIDHAYEVIDAITAAKAQGRGVVALHGKMVDAPVVARAENTIAMAEELGLGREAR